MQVVRPAQSLSLGLTRLTGEMYPLSHDKSPSSMLLISSNNEFFAYFGDTGPDDVEKSKIWIRSGANWRRRLHNNN